jgi:Spx/MgsR family transcriptional regulator
MQLHGIVNCDTVRKARAWLDAHAVPYEWVDFRKSPPATGDHARWCRAVGWETLLNRRGTTWRRLDNAAKAAVVDERSAIALMAAQPTLIKRPVVEADGNVVVGFTEDGYAARFAKK